MTVVSSTSASTHVWTGVETTFATGIACRDLTHLDVVLVEAGGTEYDLTLGVHYSGVLTLGLAVLAPIVLPALGTLQVTRNVPLVQGQVFPGDDNYDPAAHELAHDLAAMRLADLMRRVVDLQAVAIELDAVTEERVLAEAAATLAQYWNGLAQAAALAAQTWDPSGYYTKTAADALLAAKAPLASPSLTGSASAQTLAVTGKFSLVRNATTLVIAAGAIIATASLHTVDTEAAAATDDLDTITGFAASGHVLILRGANAARIVTVRSGTGNIVLNSDCSLNKPTDTLTLEYDGAAAAWIEVARSGSEKNTLIGRAYASSNIYATLTTTIPADDTIPQITEGTQVLSGSYTPKSARSRIRFRFTMWFATSAAGNLAAALFLNGAAGAVQVSVTSTPATASQTRCMGLEYEFAPGAGSAIAWAIRVGNDSGSVYLLGASAARLYGGAASVTMVVEEFEQ